MTFENSDSEIMVIKVMEVPTYACNPKEEVSLKYPKFAELKGTLCFRKPCLYIAIQMQAETTMTTLEDSVPSNNAI